MYVCRRWAAVQAAQEASDARSFSVDGDEFWGGAQMLISCPHRRGRNTTTWRPLLKIKQMSLKAWRLLKLWKSGRFKTRCWRRTYNSQVLFQNMPLLHGLNMEVLWCHSLIFPLHSSWGKSWDRTRHRFCACFLKILHHTVQEARRRCVPPRNLLWSRGLKKDQSSSVNKERQSSLLAWRRWWSLLTHTHVWVQQP